MSGGGEEGARPGDGAMPSASEPTARQAFDLTAEWALWGKRATETGYSVLECSAGSLTSQDFEDNIRRYAPGTADRLPQYTVSWVPRAGAPEFIAMAIHEHAPYGQPRPGGPDRYDAFRSGIVVVRLFCVHYADLAEHRVSYAQLLDAVQQQELPRRGAVASASAGPPGPVTIHFPQRPAKPLPAGTAGSAGPAEDLAEAVAALLLTNAPVCVVGAYEVSAADRIAFVDSVLSLLPYGLRATLSVSTWASSTAQDLKLRLFFASAPRDDGGRTRHVWWRPPDPGGFPEPEGAARLYLDWLHRTGVRARSLLASQTAPLRFTSAEIRRMVAALPGEPAATDSLKDLAARLAAGDIRVASAEVQRLQRKLSGPVDTADRDGYRRQVTALGLLKDHPGLDDNVKASVYEVLLRLVFDTPLSYASYCQIEDAIGGPPRGVLRSVVLGLNFVTFLPWLLAVKAEPGFTDDQLEEALAEQDAPAAAPLTALQQHVEDMRPAHRPIIYDFAMWYLRTHAEDPRTELIRRGYVADILEAVFPGDRRAQGARLEDTLRFVYGRSLGRSQIRELFAGQELHPTATLEAAVRRLASSRDEQFISEQAALARLRNAGYANDVRNLRRGSRRRSLRHAPDSGSRHAASPPE
jgi:hypothetical protein